MKLEKVLFEVGDETRTIGCYQITAESGEHCHIWDDRLYPSTLPIIDRQIKRANRNIASFKRNCEGLRYERRSVTFWEAMLKSGLTRLEEVSNA